MALILEGTLKQEYRKFLSSHPRVGFINISDQHVIIAPIKPIRSVETLNALAEEIKERFDPGNQLASCLRRAQEIDGLLILPEICFLKDETDVVNCFIYPIESLAERFAEYRRAHGNSMFSHPKTDIEQLESRLIGEYYLTWRALDRIDDPNNVNGSNHVLQIVTLNGKDHKNRYTDEAFALAGS